jgi:hypothetical protein
VKVNGRGHLRPRFSDTLPRPICFDRAKRRWLLLCRCLGTNTYRTLFTSDITSLQRYSVTFKRQFFFSFFTFTLRMFLVFSDSKYYADKRATDRVSERNKSHMSFPGQFAIKPLLLQRHIISRGSLFPNKNKVRELIILNKSKYIANFAQVLQAQKNYINMTHH